MNQKLQAILDIIQQSEKLDAEQKNNLLKAVKDADKELEITSFKLERTEKVKKTTAILLEETIEELEQKRKAVEAQNRELEIEASLERVRAIAMSMNKSDDLLSICEVSFNEFKKLGFNNLRNSLINIFNDEEESFVNYDYSDYLGGSISNDSYNSNTANEEFLIQIRKANDAFVETVIDRNQLDEWKEFRRSHGEQDDPRLDNINALYYYNYSIGSGSIGISNFNPISEEQQLILKRFRNVFNLSYQRYADIAQAEAQAREAKIEAALEKVRAVAMSMQKADGLLEVVEILNIELRTLGFTDIRNTIINIFNDTKENFINYDYSDYGVGGISEVDYNSHPANKKFVNKMREASTDFMITEFTDNELDEWKKWRSDQGQMPDSKLDQSESLYYYEYSIGVGSIGISTFSPISEDQLEVLKRFRNVFKLSYQRYVDITLAEAQAREAQIELALERVRARTMGMQRSEELKEVIQVVYEQFVHLNIHIEHTGFIMDYKARDDMHIWLADRHDVPFEVTIPYFDCAHWNSFIEAKEKGIDFFANHLTFEEKNKFYQDLFKLIPGVPKETLEYYFSCPGLAISTVLLENVGLYIENFSGIPYTDEENNTLMRFGKVFQQTYTRFNDLKQAEAQAREAQIENALEKVRSRTMAMQKSEELSETAKVFFEQMHALGELPDRIGINIIKEDEKLFEIWATNQDGSNLDHRFRATIEEPTSYSKLYAAWKAKKDYIIIDLKGQELKKWIKFVREKIKMTVDDKNIKGRRIHNATFFSNGVLLCTTHEPVKDEVIKLLVRFAKVFDQTYRRFLDLQKAEAQARESQIEAALERVRSKTMAMHNSHDVGATVVTLFDEVLKLGLDKSIRVGIGILEGNEHMETWSATSSSEGKVDLKMGMLDMTIHPMLIGLKKAWESGETGYSYDYIGDDVFRYYEALNNEPDYPFQADLDSLPENEYHKSFFYKEGILFSFAPNPISDESAKVLNRFAGVFGQTYRRYLDLQKAEAQAREAQIEAALERVRTNAMAMQTSDDLAKIVEIVFTELKKVGFETIRCGIGIIESAETKKVDIWSTTLADENLSIQISGDEVLEGHALLDGIIEHWVNQTEFSHVLEGDEFLKYYQAIEKTNFHLPDFAQKNLSKDERQYYYMVPCKAGGIYAFSIVPFTVEVKKLMRRFIEVFQLAYTRYVDLQKAESQARESQIQLALERVRARTMAMHKSDELAETAAVLFQQMKELGVTPERLNICLINEETNNLEVWSTDQEGFKINHHFNANLEEPTTGAKVYKAWKEKKKSLIIELSGQELNDWIKYVREVMGMTIKEELIKERRIHSVAFFSHGMILTTTPEPLPDESMNLQERFADVFNLTYRRFLDLKNAEAQTREAQIEASLERVRSKAMSMHSPNDLSETVNVFFKELKTLGIIPIRCGVGQIDEATQTTSLTTTTSSQQGDSFEVIGKVKQTGHPVLDGIFDHWKMQKEYHPVLEGVDIKAYYDVMNAQIAYPDYQEDLTQYGNNFYFKEGFIFAWTESKLSEEELQIFRRFTSVLSLTYRRYIDLKEAEIRTFEAVRQASLDRVRAEIASMRTSEDLNHITPIIWRELKNLEVPFFRCGVYIVDEKTQTVQVYLSTPDGKPLGVLNLSFDSNKTTSNTVDHWRKKIVYKTHWDREEFIEWTKSMMKLGQIQSAETYQGSTTPPESLYLHFVPFAQGMLYVGDVQPLTDEKLQLVKTLAEAFSIAYARYEDFKNLEAAKNKIEITLFELKSAQAQLVHSEKMASLGELTAGIAHEIKNPLNFVNNFSEISRELLDEMKIEIENKNIDEIIELIEDLKQNLEKINQHGKRADSIVKGMLLHSRGSSGEKTLTDINELLDQYVNLAYHGMRAQNKEFNISIEKNYDETLEKINVVPQDISRVFLNIINNACYAAYDRKKKSSDDGFLPTLKVSTKRLNGKVEIRIGDNGDGIPKDILDKIFQPFFTTKPTGEGTGLGLSLSYDIVTKVHGGELKVETEEGNRTEFIIILNN